MRCPNGTRKTKMVNVFLKQKGNVVRMVPEKTKMVNVFLTQKGNVVQMVPEKQKW